MKKLIIFMFMVCFLTICSFSQTTLLDLTFTAIDNATHVQLDSIKVINKTQNVDTVLYWPDTTLVLFTTGVQDNYAENRGFQLFHNYPNPVVDKATVNICVPGTGTIHFTITDALGKNVINDKWALEKGCHEFSFSPGNAKVYFLTANWENRSQTIKILNLSQGVLEPCALEYRGATNDEMHLKNKNEVQRFFFFPGNKLIYIGYFDTIQSGRQDHPEGADTITFQFATNIPCPGLPTIDYGGQTYNTIQVCDQCWMKENLNVGVRINSPKPATNNDTIEKYCLGDMEQFCDVAGGLYYWNEMMQYTTGTGGQGICPEGWHIPSDLDWQILEGTVDSKFGINNSEWNRNGWRGEDAGGSLKQTGTEYWEYPNTGATDAFGFTVLPGGYFVQGDFWGAGYKAYFWTSDNSLKYFRNFDWNEKIINRNSGEGGGVSISVRCIKNQ